MEESIKDAVISHLTKVYSLDMYAQTKEIELSEEEKDKVTQAAETYYKSLNRTERNTPGRPKRTLQRCMSIMRWRKRSTSS